LDKEEMQAIRILNHTKAANRKNARLDLPFVGAWSWLLFLHLKSNALSSGERKLTSLLIPLPPPKKKKIKSPTLKLFFAV